MSIVSNTNKIIEAPNIKRERGRGGGGGGGGVDHSVLCHTSRHEVVGRSVSVKCDRLRQTSWSSLSVSVRQHVNLGTRPRDIQRNKSNKQT